MTTRTDSTPRDRAPARWLSALVAVALVVSVGATSPAEAAPGSPRSTAGTSGCRAVGGAAVDGGGPNRATVVVDTGSGAVWSACIAFSGTISGIEAIELAASQIPDLSPVYDIYTGQGRAVCQLRGVGNPPPDCLGQSAAYWAYFHDGTYSRTGAGSTRVADGDIDGWRWGNSSNPPRRATDGYEAVTRTAPPATTTTTSTTAPHHSSGSGSGNGSGSGSGAGSGSGSGGALGATPGAVPSANGSGAGVGSGSGSSGATTTSTVDPRATTTSTTVAKAETAARSTKGSKGPGASDAGDASRSGSGRAEARSSTAGGQASVLPAIKTVDRSSGTSGASSAIGFVLALAVALGIGAALRVRRRRVSLPA